MTAAPRILTEEEALAELGEEGLRTAARHARWRAGDLSYHCSEIQRRGRALVYEHPARRPVFETCRRFGKTRTCVTIADEKAIAFPGIRIPYAAPTAKQVRTFVHPHMLELASHAPDDLAPDLVDGEQVFPPLQWYDAAGNPVRTLLDGGTELARYRGRKVDEQLRMSRVAPHGCEDRKKADALRGTGTVFAVVDEARDIPILWYVLRSVIGPMLWEARSRWHEEVDPSLLVASTPADDATHPFNGVADAARDTGAYLTATVYDCDHLGERDIAEAIEEAGGEHTVAWQVEGLAKRVRDPERVAFPEWDAETHVGEVERPTHFRPCVIGDGGFVDLALYLFGYLHFELDLLVVERELVFRRTRSDITDAAIAALERELWGDVQVSRRRVDAQPQVRADMNREEWGDPDEWALPDRDTPHWGAVTKPRTRAGSMQQGVNRVRALLSQAGRILVHPSCTRTIAHVDACRWNSSRTEFLRVRDEKGEPVHHFDGAAALVYFARDLDRANPFPVSPEGVGLPTHMIREHRLRQTEEQKLASIFGRGRRARR